MAKLVGIKVYIKFYCDCVRRGWVNALDWDVRACWPVLLSIVKVEGHCGQIGMAEFQDWCELYRVPWDSMNAFLGAAMLHGAIRIRDGVLAVLKWKEYQTDPGAYERVKKARGKSETLPAPLPKEETETETETETVTDDARIARITAYHDDAATVEIGDGGIGNPPRTNPLPDIPLEVIGHVRQAYLAWCDEHGYPKNWRGGWDSDISEHCRINGDALALAVTPAIIDSVDRRAAKEMKPWVSCPKSWFAEAEQRAKPKRTATGPTIRAAMDPAEVLEASRKRGEEERKRAMAKGATA